MADSISFYGSLYDVQMAVGQVYVINVCVAVWVDFLSGGKSGQFFCYSFLCQVYIESCSHISKFKEVQASVVSF